jgi:hypothetical protein
MAVTASVGSEVILRKHQDAEDQYLIMVGFPVCDRGMESSDRPETAEFAAFLAEISEGALKFGNLDVLREEDL